MCNLLRKLDLVLSDQFVKFIVAGIVRIVCANLSIGSPAPVQFTFNLGVSTQKMKTIVSTFIISIASLFTASALQAEEAVFFQADFEQQSLAVEWPEGWSRVDGVTWEEEDGNRFVRLQSEDPTKMLMFYREIALPFGTRRLELSWRQRVTDLLRGDEAWYDARIMMEVLDAGRKKISAKLPAPKTGRDTDGWVEKSIEFDVPEGSDILKFMPTLFRVHGGKFDLDDIKLRVVQPE